MLDWLRCQLGYHRLRFVRGLSFGCTLRTCIHCRRYFAYNPRSHYAAVLPFDCELYHLHRAGGDVGLEVYLPEGVPCG